MSSPQNPRPCSWRVVGCGVMGRILLYGVLLVTLMVGGSAWEMIEKKVWWDPHEEFLKVQLERPISELQEVRLLNGYLADSLMLDDHTVQLTAEDLFPGWNIVRIYCTLKGEHQPIVPQLGSAHPYVKAGDFPQTYQGQSGYSYGQPNNNNPSTKVPPPTDPNIRGALPGRIIVARHSQVEHGLEQFGAAPGAPTTAAAARTAPATAAPATAAPATAAPATAPAAPAAAPPAAAPPAAAPVTPAAPAAPVAEGAGPG